MKSSISNIVDKMFADICTLQSLLKHASAIRRTKEEIREDLDKMSDIIDEIERLIR